MSPVLSDVEIRIVDELQRNARLSTAELAPIVNMSASPTWRRIKRLEDLGIIQGYQAVLDARRLGLQIEAFITIAMGCHDERGHQLFVAAVSTVDEIVSCHRVSGGGDYVLNIVTRDMETFSNLLTRVVGPLPGVARVQTSFVLSAIKPKVALPVGMLKGRSQAG